MVTTLTCERAPGGFVDRVAEQALVAECIEDPECGAAILLRGPAGAGKSALAEDAVLRAGASRRILLGSGLPRALCQGREC
jgi:DNA helicase TIP49 (TBP-interacting protein)